MDERRLVKKGHEEYPGSRMQDETYSLPPVAAPLNERTEAAPT
jgi:hypothetical protein